MSKPSRRSRCSITTTSCFTGRRWSAKPSSRRRDRRALQPRAGRRIPGHQPPAGRAAAGHEARREAASPWSATMRSRFTAFAALRCATSSTIPQCFDPPARLITLERNYRSTQPILAAANAVIAQASGALQQSDLWSERDFGAEAAGHCRARRGRPGDVRRRPSAGASRERNRAQGAGGALSRRVAQRPRPSSNSLGAIFRS